MFNEFEISRDSGAPVELYEFTLEGYVWRYTSADTDQDYGGVTWSAVTMTRSEIEESAEINRATLKLTVSGDHSVALLYLKAPPAGVVLLKIRRLHRLDGDDEAIIVWIGRVLNCEWAGNQATLAAEPIYTSIRQTGLRRMYSKVCPHVLYGTACRVNAASYAEALTVTSVSALTLGITGGGHANTPLWFAGGLLAWNDGTYVRRVGVESHENPGVIKLIAPLWGLAAGASVTLYPGCDHNLKTCREKFGNNANFGGFKWIPNVNPFTTAVF
jgi:uncharacterized phage protein (TIGR02218 family)